MDEHEAWLAERNAAVRRQQIDREEAIERRQQEARQAEQRASREVQVSHAKLTGEPVPSHDDILARARALAEATDPGRDQGAEYGSSTRPAMFVTAADGSPVEVTARPRVQRSAAAIRDTELLQRARAVGNDSFMALEIAKWERRRAAAREGAEVSRASGDDWNRRSAATPEIVRTVAYGDDGVARNFGPEISR